MECIDLESRFPGYKIGYEDQGVGFIRDLWGKVIVCRSGHICPAGGTKLWACTDSNLRKASIQMRSGDMPCEVKMDGDDGVNAEFDVRNYQQFFDLMGAKKR